MKCSGCGASILGQTLKGRFRYSRCRRALVGPHHDRCDSCHVRGELVEEATLEEAAAILASPAMILGQLQHGPAAVAPMDIASPDHRLAALDKRRERLPRLFQTGEADEDYFIRESAKVRAGQERLGANAAPVERPVRVPEASRLDELCAAVRAWLLERADEDLELVAEALQLRSTADTDAAEVTGEIPEERARAWRDADVRPVVGG